MTTTTATLTIDPPVHEAIRLTIPAREALTRAGNAVDPGLSQPGSMQVAMTGTIPNVLMWRVTMMGTVPSGLVLALIGHGAQQHRGLRLTSEPEYPSEWRDGVAWYERGEWVPCPRKGCGRALVWYEAGYAPGYRVCTAGHHAQLSEDGRSAKVM